MRTAHYLAPLLALTLLVGCKEEHHGPTRGGEVVIGTTMPPSPLNPLTTWQTLSAVVAPLVFEPLVSQDRRGELHPELAESWEVAGDRITFHLRWDAQFHDSTPVTARDVVYTLDAMTTDAHSVYRSSLASLLRQWEAVDDDTVILQVATAPTAALRQLAFIGIMPASHPDVCPHRDHPLGSGPFRLAFRSAEEMVLEAVPDYYPYSPWLDRIRIKVYPDDARMWAALMRGEIDIYLATTPKDYDFIRTIPTFRCYGLPLPRVYQLGFNVEASLLADVRIRRAISQAIDREAIRQRVFSGLGEVATSPFNPFLPVVDATGGKTTYRPMEAIALLEEAGWQDRDGDGIRERGEERLEFSLLLSEAEEHTRNLGAILQRYLLEVGIFLQLQYVENDDFLQRLTTGAFTAFVYDGPIHFDPAILYSYFSSAGIPHPGTATFSFDLQALNFYRYRNPAFDTAISQALAVPEDQAIPFFQEAARQLWEDPPAAFLLWPRLVMAVDRRLHVVDPEAAHFGLDEWWVERGE